MGIGAYQRGSASIREGIERDYMENRGGYSKQLRVQMARAEQQVMLLEQFCLDAQSLYVDVTDELTTKGFLKRWMYEQWLKKRQTKRFTLLISNCTQAHCDWVNSDHRHVFLHLGKCRTKANAWLTVLKLLNKHKLDYPFNVPST
jgi:hypothetical protein